MLKNKSFLKLFCGQVLANIGDILYTISVISSAYHLTNSALVTSAVPAIITGSMMVSGLVAPIIINRYDLNIIWLVTQLGKCIGLLPLVLIINYSNHVNIVTLYLIVALIAFLDGFAQPVSNSLVPFYVDESKLIQANSLLESSNQLLSIGGWASGSILLIFFKSGRILIFSLAFSFGAALLLIWLPKVTRIKSNANLSWHELTLGWYSIWHSKLLRVLTGMDVLETIAETVWASAIIIVFVSQVLNLSQEWWGYVNALYMVGTFIGAVVTYSLGEIVNRNIDKFIFWGAFLASLLMLFVAYNTIPLVLLALSALTGVANEIKTIPQDTVIQRNISRNQLPLLYATQNILYMGTYSVATLMMGSLAELIGVKYIFILSSGLLLITSVMAYKNKTIFSNR
ncbi:MFS transporter [Lactiplantibacillus plantarum]|nr:MFS transporter [Lactiplantibacillus plantarum]